MRTALSMQLPATRPQITNDPAVSVAITAGSDVHRAKIERLARRAGARVVLEGAKFQILLLAIDAPTALPSSIPALGLLAPAAADVCVIWCGGTPGRNVISQLLRAGVAGIVSSDIQSHQFQAALGAIKAGLQVVDPRLLHEEAVEENVSYGAEELTEREQEVLAMMGQGLSNKEISSRLAISTHTVKFHISSILGKLGAASRTEAVTLGIRSGKLTI